MYKIIKNNKIIDVTDTPHFVRFLASGHIAFTDKTSAQGIVSSDGKTAYSFTTGVSSNAEIVTIEEITVEEFSRLQNLLNSGQDAIADDTPLKIARQATIKRLSSNCKNKITAGFSITLSDNKLYNFKLTAEDQLNLMMIENQINSGMDTFIYHATDQPCRFYTRDDMLKIISAFKRCILYHTTYFNVAKQYINSLVDIEQIKLFTYGTDVSSAVEDVVLKQILKNGGDIE